MAKPLWRRTFDRVERPLGGALEEVAGSGAFAQALNVTLRARAAARAQLERRTRRVWHLANLPAGSDVKRLHRQVVELDREVRRLRQALEAAERRREDGDGSARPRAAGRRAKRPARS